MPLDYRKYPAAWKQVVAQLHERAGGQCEAVSSSGRRCGVPHGETITRDRKHPDLWGICGDPPQCDPTDDTVYHVRVVLTAAHTCACDPLCADPAHLQLLCQLHHLRLDAKLHGRHAAETRRRKRIAAGQGAML